MKLITEIKAAGPVDSSDTGISNWSLGRLMEFFELDNGLSFFSKLLSITISLLLIIGIIVFLFYFIISAIAWMTSGGDKAKTVEARSRITNALVGIVIMLSTFAIIKFIEYLFGISILSINIPTILT